MSGPEILDSLLYECTKSVNDALDAAAVEKFCSAVDSDLDGPSTAARLLGHKIQSPQQQESLNALCVTDECVKRCGRRFQDEVGKFRFLNEIIKMISPKYFGDKTAPKVKSKCIELLYRWTLDLRHEPKILDAYDMLKRQGIIDDDPILGDTATNGEVGVEAYPTANETVSAVPIEDDKANHSIFGDEDKSKLLARLLRSKHPDDLQAANRLIKNMVRQDEEKQEKISQRYNLLETVRNNVKLLNEMLDCYQMAGGSSTSDRDIIKELYKNIDVERPRLFKLASDTEDKDSEGMSQILQVNDDVVQISQRYKQVIEQGEGAVAADQKSAAPASNDLAGLDLAGSTTNSSDLFSSFQDSSDASNQASATATPKNTTSSILELFSTPPVMSAMPTVPSLATAAPQSTFSALNSAPPTFQSSASSIFQSSVPPALSNPVPLVPVFHTGSTTTTTSNLDDLFTFNSAATPSTPATTSASIMTTTASFSDDIGLLSLDGAATDTAGLAAPLMPANDSLSLFDTSPSTEAVFGSSKKAALEDLDFLGQDLLQKTKPTQQVVEPVRIADATSSVGWTRPVAAPVVRQSLNQLKATTVEQRLNPTVPAAQSAPAPAAVPVQPLTNIHVPINNVKPGDLPPLTVYEKDSVKLVIHFAQNLPREDVSVMVISITSSKDTAIKAVMFQAAVPKAMKVKLQPPSASELPAYNPILPPSAITQVMLLANPNKEKVKLKYKLSYMANGSPVAETGDVTNFPLR